MALPKRSGVRVSEGEMKEYDVRMLFYEAPYFTNAIGDAFNGAPRADVLLVKGLLDTLADAISRANGLPSSTAALPRPADEEPRRDPARLWPQRRGQS